MTYPLLGWLFSLALTLHNAEEALFLPGWSRKAGRWHVPVGAFEFRFAVAVLTLLAWGLAHLSANQGPGSAAAHALAGYALAMLLNVLVPHTVATIALGRYAPGTATAWILNLPACAALLHVGIRSGYLDSARLVWFGPACVGALLAGIPILFFMGRMLARCCG